MEIPIDYARERMVVDVVDDRLVKTRREPEAPPLRDPAQAVRAALDAPRGFPPLRQAITPDDHIAIVVDDHLSRLPDLLSPILEYLSHLGVQSDALALVIPPGASLGWRDRLGAPFRDVPVEVHDPACRQKLSYLATTKKGRRLYLNRRVIDADQLVVLGRCAYDAIHGYSGGEGDLFPALCDEATRHEFFEQLTTALPGEEHREAQQEAIEVAWLLGIPFMVQIVEGTGDEVTHVVAGTASATAEGRRLLDARWRLAVERPAHTVIAGLSGDPAHHDFGDLARALLSASRIVQPGGRIVLLSGARPSLGTGADLLGQAEDPEKGIALLRRETPSDTIAAFQWAVAVQQASVFLLSDLPASTAEDLFVTPLDSADQVRRLIEGNGSLLFLNDAHKTLTYLEN